MTVVDEISNVISGCIVGLHVSTKVGKSLLQPSVARALRSAGFVADE